MSIWDGMIFFNRSTMRVFTEELIRKASMEKLPGPGDRWAKRCLTAVALFSLFLGGCRSPATYRTEADNVASSIVTAKQEEAFGRTEPFTIERPSDILRRRLLAQQNLAVSSQASLGTDQLEPTKHWPEPNYPQITPSDNLSGLAVEPNKPVKLSLIQALQVGAHNSLEYQSRKEDVFRTAMALDLTRNNFRNIFSARAQSDLSTDTTATELANNATAGVSRSLKNGADMSGAMAINLVNLLTQGGASSLGLSADATVSVPLMRGSGEHIAAEPLTQAERNVIYELWDFERYKRTFAVSIARGYFNVLRQMDVVANAEDNYRSAVASARWSRRRADAGRIREIEVDQAIQRELGARNSWISTQEQLKSSLDSFKNTIGLPVDALIELDPNDLVELRGLAEKILEQIRAEAQREVSETAPPADAPVQLVPVSFEDAGPLEIGESVAIELALKNRLDLQAANGGVYDAQRKVVVKADALRAGLTLGGTGRVSDTDDDGSLRFDRGNYAALLTLDLPVERTRERNEYRNSLIDLERATRTVQTLEDQIKLSIRSELRALLESRESLKIQAQSVVVAEKRVRSTTFFLEAGRTEIRNLLEAQDALLSAQNGLTRSVVDYRIAELELQRDLDLLEVNEQGLWREFSPEVIDNVEQ
ncbi:MAG TPA: TolC family protein [Sedimentisphaerales bacterium]|nr:TolC family protein [Sedimentisphaerales bacterium]